MSDQYDNKKSQKKQKWLLIGGAGAIVIFLTLIIMSTGEKEPAKRPNTENNQTLNVDATVSDNISDTEMLTQTTRGDINDLQKHMGELQSQLQAQKETESLHMASLMNQFSQEFAGIKTQLEDIRKTPPPTLNGADGLPGGKNMVIPPVESPVVEEPAITSINLDKHDESSTSSDAKTVSSNDKVKHKDSFLSIGFAKAKTITSIDAPCGGTAQDNPFPILLNITDDAQMANRMKTKLKECFVLASGYGDVASERAYFRTERMSCIGKNGKVMEMKVDGYIVGEDGKAGLRGRLVSKEGSKLVLALLSGTIGGLGSAFANMATTVQQTSVGTNQVVNPSQSLGYAGATGVSQGFNQLSQYYINLAEKTFPVIEIVDQRNVTVVFTNGTELPVNLNDSAKSAKLPISVN